MIQGFIISPVWLYLYLLYLVYLKSIFVQKLCMRLYPNNWKQWTKSINFLTVKSHNKTHRNMLVLKRHNNPLSAIFEIVPKYIILNYNIILNYIKLWLKLVQFFFVAIFSALDASPRFPMSTPRSTSSWTGSSQLPDSKFSSSIPFLSRGQCYWI
jgi:hypothetical protein